MLARWTVRPRLMGIPGVANVAIWGHRDRQLQVLVDPAHLRDERRLARQVVGTAGNAQLVSPLTFLNASTPGTGGFLDGPNQRLGVRHILPFAEPDDLAQVPVEGSSASLGDVATVVEDHPPLIGDAVAAGGEPDDACSSSSRSCRARTRWRHAPARRRRSRRCGPGLAGVRIDSSVFRPASFIESALDHLRLALIIAAALVAARAGGVPHAVARGRDLPRRDPALARDGARSCSTSPGATMNALVVAGLVVAIGAVVDDAVGGRAEHGARLREERAVGATARRPPEHHPRATRAPAQPWATRR